MMSAKHASWPPPPDLESIKELVRNADVEGLIEIHGAPADEYDTEAEALHAAIAHLRTNEITVSKQLPILESIWRRNFIDDDAELALRRPALEGLAKQIARFFGPDAQPRTRQSEQE
jgi:hypothetical protein